MSPSLYTFGLAGVFSVVATAGAACSADPESTTFGDEGGGGSGTTHSGPTSSGEGVGGFNPVTTGAGGTGPGECVSGQNEDKDKDGIDVASGDCNDCDPNVNPGAIEVVVTEPDMNGMVPEPADEDCDGMVDNVLPECDDGLALDDPDPNNGARAVDLCQQATGKKWGVESAAYVRADGSPSAAGLEVGIMDSFGPNVNVQLGKRMLALSSGYSRTPAQPGNCGGLSCTVNGAGVAPPGFPQDVPNCPGDTAINDDIGLEVKIKSPTNATGYSFLFKFYSFEYPEWVCTSYNDQFIALVAPPPMGSINGNISFDSMTNPVSVNVAFFDVCAGCPAGIGELQDTGYDIWNDAGATSWLKTSAPLKGGDEVTIRFAIWDTGDALWDSLALVDSFQWVANGGTVGVGTGRNPDPK